MQKITPHLWFDREAKEAAEFYVAAFGGDSKVKSVKVLHNTPSGDTDIVSFRLLGYDFMAISAGPLFKLNPSVSFFVNFDPTRDPQAREHLDALWSKLSQGGTPLMPLQGYPFSKWYGWIQDRYGLSWQLILTEPAGEPRPNIVPSLLFVGDVAGKAEAAIDYYVSTFKDAKRGMTERYPAGMELDKEGTIMFADFKLENQWFAAMDSAHEHSFKFNESISLMIHCQDQAEIDYYWGKLSRVQESEQCGWCKDQFGVSWQVVPRAMDEIFRGNDQAKINRVTQAFLKMKKLDLETLRQAAEGR